MYLFLVSLVTQNSLLSFAAGLISCISPTGIALGAMVLADAFFSTLFAISFVALVYGALCDSRRWTALSAVLSGIAALVKPILMFWPFVSVVIYCLLIAGSQDLGDKGEDSLQSWLQTLTGLWKRWLLLALIPLLFITSWAGLNYWRHGVFTVSSIVEMTGRYYLAAKVEAWEFAGKVPSDEAVRERRRVLEKRFEAIPTQEGKVRAYQSDSMAVFRRYPLRTAEALVDNALTNATGGWDYFPAQLPYSQKRLGYILSNIKMWEHRIRKVVLFPVMLAPIIAFIVAKIRPSQQNRRLAMILFAMTLTFLYFFICSGITFWTGPRILFPTEILIISTVATCLTLLAKTTVPLPQPSQPSFRPTFRAPDAARK